MLRRLGNIQAHTVLIIKTRKTYKRQLGNKKQKGDAKVHFNLPD